MTKLGRKRLIGALFLAAVLAMAAACRRSSADDGGGTVAKGSTQSGSDSVRVGGAPVAATAARTVLFIGTSLTAGLGLNPDSAYPQLIQEKIAVIKENIVVRRFARFRVGEETGAAKATAE